MVMDMRVLTISSKPKESMIVLPKPCHCSFNYSMIKSYHPALMLHDDSLHPCVYFHSACCPPPFLFAPVLPAFPPSLFFSPSSISSIDSGSNETSIWPVRKTQTSLPLWEEEEPWSCQGRRAKRTETKQGKKTMERCRKMGEIMKTMFPMPDLSICPSYHGPSLWRAVLNADFKTAWDS